MAIWKLALIFLIVIKTNNALLCADEFVKNSDAYNECMEKNDFGSFKKKKLGNDELCNLLKMADLCFTKSEILIVNCSNYEDSNVYSYGHALKAYYEFECERDRITLKNTQMEITTCLDAQGLGLDECDAQFKYDLTKFLPLPAVNLKVADNAWSNDDCNLKYKWASCWVGKLNKCEKKVAYDRYRQLFLTILRSVPNCRRVLQHKLESEGLRTSSGVKLFFYDFILYFLLFILMFNYVNYWF